MGYRRGIKLVRWSAWSWDSQHERSDYNHCLQRPKTDLKTIQMWMFELVLN